MRIEAYCVARPNGKYRKPSHKLCLWTTAITREIAAQTYTEFVIKAENVDCPWEEFWALLEKGGTKVVPCIIEVADDELGDTRPEPQVRFNNPNYCT